eukprot:9234602-Pyramimonas_sp.AAC.2
MGEKNKDKDVSESRKRKSQKVAAESNTSQVRPFTVSVAIPGCIVGERKRSDHQLVTVSAIVVMHRSVTGYLICAFGGQTLAASLTHGLPTSIDRDCF